MTEPNPYRKMLDGIQVLSDEEMAAHDREMAARIEEAEREKKINAARTAFAAQKIPDRMHYKAFDPHHYPMVKNLFDDALRGREPKSVLIMGPTDSGKTFAAASLGRLHAGNGHCVFRVVEPDIAAMWEMSRWGRGDAMERIKQQMIDADILIYDDIGKVALANGLTLVPFGLFVFSVFDKRAERRRPTIATTRYRRDHLEKAVGCDIVRRLLLEEGRDKTRGVEIEYSEE